MSRLVSFFCVGLSFFCVAVLRGEENKPSAAERPEAASGADDSSVATEGGGFVSVWLGTTPIDDSIFDPKLPWMTVQGHPGDAVIDEVRRQAILIAAREELGLTTRDDLLFESIPQNALVIESPYEFTPDEKGAPRERGFILDVIREEKRSRTLYPDELRKRGAASLRGDRPEKSDAPLPDEAAVLLRQMTVFAQFRAVRLIHEAMRTVGDSPELLRGLVRGYLQLQLLTCDYHLDVHRVFQARALLYGARLEKKFGYTPENAFFGVSVMALNHFANGDARFRNNAKRFPDFEPGVLAEMSNAYAEFHPDALEPFLATEEKELAALLIFRLYSYATDRETHFRLYRERFLEACARLPETYCVAERTFYDTPFDVFDAPDGSPFYEGFEKNYAPSILAVEGLPEGVKTAAEDLKRATTPKSSVPLLVRLLERKIDPESEALEATDGEFPLREFSRALASLFDRMKEASISGEDRREPSLEGLATILLDEMFTMTYLVAHGINCHNGRGQDYFDETAEVTQRHPLFFYYERLLVQYDSERTAAARKRRDDLTCPWQKISAACYNFYPSVISGEGDHAMKRPFLSPNIVACSRICSENSRDLYHYLRAFRLAFNATSSYPFWTYFPNHPFFNEIKLEIPNVPFSESDRTKMEAKFDRFPNVLTPLAESDWMKGDLDRSIALQERLMAEDGSSDATERLVQCYLERGESQKALNLYGAYLETPDADEGLHRYFIASKAAQILLGDPDQKDKLLRCARLSARPGSGWGFITLADVCKSLGRFSEAKESYRALFNSYPRTDRWFRWTICDEFELPEKEEALDELLMSDAKWRETHGDKPKKLEDEPVLGDQILAAYSSGRPYPDEAGSDPLLFGLLDENYALCGYLALFDALDRKETARAEEVLNLMLARYDRIDLERRRQLKFIGDDAKPVLYDQRFTAVAVELAREKEGGKPAFELRPDWIDRSLAALRPTAVIESRLPTTFYLLGRYYDSRGDHEKAAAFYRRSIQTVFTPSNGASMFRSLALRELRKDGFSQKDYQTLMEQDPELPKITPCYARPVDFLVFGALDEESDTASETPSETASETLRRGGLGSAAVPCDPDADADRITGKAAEFKPGVYRLRRAVFRGRELDRSAENVRWFFLNEKPLQMEAPFGGTTLTTKGASRLDNGLYSMRWGNRFSPRALFAFYDGGMTVVLSFQPEEKPQTLHLAENPDLIRLDFDFCDPAAGVPLP